MNIIKEKYALNFSNDYLTNLKAETKTLESIKNNQKLNFLIFLNNNTIDIELEKINSNIENIKELKKFINIYFIVNNIEKQVLEEKLSKLDKSLLKIFYLNADNIIEKLNYSYFPLILVLDYKYNLTDLIEFEHLFKKENDNLKNYIKKITNTISILAPKKVDMTYNDRVKNGEMSFIDYSKRQWFEYLNLYGKDLSDYELIDDKGKKSTIKELNKNSNPEKLTLLVISLRNCGGCHGAWRELETYVKNENLLSMYNLYDYVWGVYDPTNLKYAVKSRGVEDTSHFYYHNEKSDFDYLKIRAYPTFIILDKNNKIPAAMDALNLGIGNLTTLYKKISGTNSIIE